MSETAVSCHPITSLRTDNGDQDRSQSNVLSYDDDDDESRLLGNGRCHASTSWCDSDVNNPISERT